MSSDEIKSLKLGDYVKLSSPTQSDEYFMVSAIEDQYRLRKVGSHTVINVDSLEEYTKVDTHRRS